MDYGSIFRRDRTDAGGNNNVHALRLASETTSTTGEQWKESRRSRESGFTAADRLNVAHNP